jgi:hypothetical protein
MAKNTTCLAPQCPHSRHFVLHLARNQLNSSFSHQTPFSSAEQIPTAVHGECNKYVITQFLLSLKRPVFSMHTTFWHWHNGAIFFWQGVSQSRDTFIVT